MLHWLWTHKKQNKSPGTNSSRWHGIPDHRGTFMLDLKHTRFYASLLFSQTPEPISILSRLHSFLLLVQLWHSTLWTASVLSKNPVFWRLSGEICSVPHDCSYTSLTVIHKVKIKYWDWALSHNHQIKKRRSFYNSFYMWEIQNYKNFNLDKNLWCTTQHDSIWCLAL